MRQPFQGWDSRARSKWSKKLPATRSVEGVKDSITLSRLRKINSLLAKNQGMALATPREAPGIPSFSPTAT
jgi:hypothetical protein